MTNFALTIDIFDLCYNHLCAYKKYLKTSFSQTLLLTICTNKLKNEN